MYMGRFLKVMAAGLLILFLNELEAQKKGYEPGYVITLEGDTLPGWIKDRSPEPFVELYRRIRFLPRGKRGTRKYGPDQIRGYAIGERLYESVALREESAFFRFRYYIDPQAEPVFLQVIRRVGPLTWYHREFVYDDNHYLDFYPLFHRSGSRELVRVTQGILGLKKNRLTEYFQDCPGLAYALDEDRVSTVQDVFQFYLAYCALPEPHVLSKGVYRIVETDSGRVQTSRKVPLPERMEELRIPGLGVALIEDYQIREVLFYGQTGGNTLIGPYTLFEAASVSKLVTALMVHHYVDQGILDLDTDVNAYLSSWKIPENNYSEKPVTLRLLLSHRSGLPPGNFEYLRERGIPTLEEILDGTAPALNEPAVPQKMPGQEWAYSNIGYVLIQKILEDRLGKPFEELAREAVFKPSGMDLSTFEYPLPEAFAENEALPHDKAGQSRPPELELPAKAQGGLLTTPRELASLVLEVLKASRWESGVFPKPVADGLLHPEIALPFKMYDQRAQMGLGALLFGAGKNVAFMHNGYNSPGSVCIAIGFPYLGKGAVVMSNSANGEALYLEIIATLAEACQWPLGQFFKPE